jgi:hypothetical protein
VSEDPTREEFLRAWQILEGLRDVIELLSTEPGHEVALEAAQTLLAHLTDPDGPPLKPAELQETMAIVKRGANAAEAARLGRTLGKDKKPTTA